MEEAHEKGFICNEIPGSDADKAFTTTLFK